MLAGEQCERCCWQGAAETGGEKRCEVGERCCETPTCLIMGADDRECTDNFDCRTTTTTTTTTTTDYHTSRTTMARRSRCLIQQELHRVTTLPGLSWTTNPHSHQAGGRQDVMEETSTPHTRSVQLFAGRGAMQRPR
jgi:hypothetical protein